MDRHDRSQDLAENGLLGSDISSLESEAIWIRMSVPVGIDFTHSDRSIADVPLAHAWRFFIDPSGAVTPTP